MSRLKKGTPQLVVKLIDGRGLRIMKAVASMKRSSESQIDCLAN